MRNIIFISVLFFSMVGAGHTSVTLNGSGLTNQQKAEIAVLIEQKKTANEKASTMLVETPVNIDKMKEWAEYGSAIGITIAAASKEIGVQADEFANTTLGMVAIAIIVWKILGQDLVTVFFSIIVLVAGTWQWMYFFQKLCVIKETYYKDDGVTIDKVEHYNSGEIDGTRFLMLIVIIGIWACSIMILF